MESELLSVAVVKVNVIKKGGGGYIQSRAPSPPAPQSAVGRLDEPWENEKKYLFFYWSFTEQ